MFANSSQVHSRQTEPHPRLGAVVRRHLAHPYRRPLAAEQSQRFEALTALLGDGNRWVLDAGCGTGGALLELQRQTGLGVLGIDKSQERLARAPGFDPARIVVLAADLVDFWQWAAQRGLRFACTYLLYPNPWPKPEQLMRRWHAHPIWPALLASTARLELRCNWPVYRDECALALDISGWSHQMFTLDPSAPPLTAFERKYQASGHPLYRLVARPV